VALRECDGGLANYDVTTRYDFSNERRIARVGTPAAARRDTDWASDVRKVVLEEPPGNLPVQDAKVEAARKRLFRGGMGDETGSPTTWPTTVVLPGSAFKAPKLPYLMYINGETGGERLDQLEPDSFRYEIRYQWRESLAVARPSPGAPRPHGPALRARRRLKPWAGGSTPPLSLQDLGRALAQPRVLSRQGRADQFLGDMCEPCAKKCPASSGCWHSLEGRPFVVLAVNLAEPPSRIRGYLEKMPLRFTVLLDRDTAAAKAWKARILPATYIVGPDGKIRYSTSGS
jgi:hypothetical protein